MCKRSCQSFVSENESSGLYVMPYSRIRSEFRSVLGIDPGGNAVCSSLVRKGLGLVRTADAG